MVHRTTPGALRLGVAVASRVARRPVLWPAALRQLHRTTPAGWWRRPPFRPGPPADYAAFRFQTMYGGAGTPADAGPAAADDLVGWLAWSRHEPRAGGGGAPPAPSS